MCHIVLVYTNNLVVTVRLRWTGIFPPATVEKNQVEMIKSHKTRWFYAQVNPQSTVVYPHLASSGRCES